MSSLRLDRVHYQYAGTNKDVLTEVSCNFEGGSVSAVIGPSGSGKTTLLSIMAGLDRPTAGAVFIDGQDLKDMDLDLYRREKVSLIFQAFQLFPLLTAVENVSFPMEINGVDRKTAESRAKEFLNALGIDATKHHRYPSNLSGGEQQRVAIARTLASGAKVLLADEPSGNLDGENSRIILDILKNLAHQQDFCVIIVTHDLEIAEASDFVWQMKDGQLTFQGNEEKA